MCYKNNFIEYNNFNLICVIAYCYNDFVICCITSYNQKIRKGNSLIEQSSKFFRNFNPYPNYLVTSNEIKDSTYPEYFIKTHNLELITRGMVQLKQNIADKEIE